MLSCCQRCPSYRLHMPEILLLELNWKGWLRLVFSASNLYSAGSKVVCTVTKTVWFKPGQLTVLIFICHQTRNPFGNFVADLFQQVYTLAIVNDSQLSSPHNFEAQHLLLGRCALSALDLAHNGLKQFNFGLMWKKPARRPRVILLDWLVKLMFVSHNEIRRCNAVPQYLHCA